MIFVRVRAAWALTLSDGEQPRVVASPPLIILNTKALFFAKLKRIERFLYSTMVIIA